MVKISPSILSVELDNIKEEIKSIENEIEYVHIDVMDGEFVNNRTHGLEMLERVHAATSLPIDTHLMVENPEDWLEDYSISNIITFHIEVVDYDTAERIIDYLHEHDIKVGISLKPETPTIELVPYIDKIDQVLIMLVEPGYGGQQMMDSCLEKIKEVREMRPEIDIEVDGGINEENAYKVKEAGANIIVAGTAIFNADDKLYVIRKLKE